ncbi:hypothetical protein TIFTF001_045897 [Ficus carica]|uniref:Uncharacterized protein n=1 Tax=Ficus carica TaxID=3494 RepID=A0AA87Z3D8_FICCA|nr:hypothetical protein TIFTF001_045897 [Ficus carica]
MSSDESPRYLVAPEFLFCPIPSQLVPPPLPASKISIATSYLRSCPYVRDPATEGSFLPDFEPKPRASTFAGIRSSDKLARRRSGDRERGDPNLLHSRSLVERRSTMTSSARSTSGVGHRISARDCMEQEIHFNLVRRALIGHAVGGSKVMDSQGAAEQRRMAHYLVQ